MKLGLFERRMTWWIATTGAVAWAAVILLGNWVVPVAIGVTGLLMASAAVGWLRWDGAP